MHESGVPSARRSHCAMSVSQGTVPIACMSLYAVLGTYGIDEIIDIGARVGDVLRMYVRWHTSSTQVVVAALVSAPHYGQCVRPHTTAGVSCPHYDWCVGPHTMAGVLSPTLRLVCRAPHYDWCVEPHTMACGVNRMSCLRHGAGAAQ